MDYEILVASLRRARGLNFDRDAAMTRVQRRINELAGVELHIKSERGYYRFYAARGRDEDYLNKTDERLYPLVRKRYCKLLIQLLSAKDDELEPVFDDLRELLMKYQLGGLELERIVLSKKQYKWYRGRFIQKPQGDASHPLEDYFVRSKSEQTDGKVMLRMGVPFHFEERLKINVRPLVEKLREQVATGDFYNWEFGGKLYYVKDGVTNWKVPPELRWMNAPGSVWKTYDPATGCITIYPDFTIMLADGDFVRWEHEGLTDDFIYRCNATERVSLMQITRTVEAENMIVTHEFDSDDEARLEGIIEDTILPRLWW